MSKLRQPNNAAPMVLALWMLAWAAPLRQADLPREVVLLIDIKTRMKQNLDRIPNYTCLETMVRTKRPPGKSKTFRRTDVLRFEVAEISGDELFALPGDHNFRKMALTELASEGLTTSGSFALLANAVFKSTRPQYHLVGNERLDGRTLIRYDFWVPEVVSGYRVSANNLRAIVGYHGSFWADPKSLDVVRLEMATESIPPRLGIAQAGQHIDYAPVRIGGSNALLPQSGEVWTRQLTRQEERNELTFTHCREYGVEATISFAEPGAAVQPSGASRDVDLPVGLQLTVGLTTPIDSGKLAVGDPIAGEVVEDAKLKNDVVVHKSAVVSGRVRRLEQSQEGGSHMLAWLEFTGMEFEGKTARFFAEFEKLTPAPGSEKLDWVATRNLPGIVAISQMGDRMLLPAGTRLVWKTLSYKQTNGR